MISFTIMYKNDFGAILQCNVVQRSQRQKHEKFMVRNSLIKLIREFVYYITVLKTVSLKNIQIKKRYPGGAGAVGDWF